MPLQLSEGNCQYTPLSIGSNTLNPGQSGVPGPGQQGNTASSFGVFYGIQVIGLGTNTTTGTATGGAPVTVNAYDIIPPTGLGSNTAATTNALLNGTQSVAGVLQAGVPGVGVRYKGALVVVTSGPTTLGACNCLWD